jgi:hypothetical protein
MPRQRHNSRNLFAAWLCLFAAICLYAPLTLSAWPASVSCCDGNHCAIPGHAHRGASSESRRAMQCQHGSSSMADCTMACCQQQERAPISPVAYVMPPLAALPAPGAAAPNLPASQPNNFPRFIEPLSPPPRTSFFSL